MTVWLAGMRATADRMNDNTEETITSGATASTGWTLNSFEGKKVNGVTTINVFCERTGAALLETTNNGNLTDTAMVTLPTAYRPPTNVEGIWGNGSNDGSVTISSTTGIITVRSTSGTVGIATSSNVRVTATWVSGNT